VTRSSTVRRATAPNKVWSWDITWLPDQRAWHLPASISRHGCLEPAHRRLEVADRESRSLRPSSSLRSAATAKSIRGGWCCTPTMASPMRGSTIGLDAAMAGGGAVLQAVPTVSNDNPYSESLFRT